MKALEFTPMIIICAALVACGSAKQAQQAQQQQAYPNYGGYQPQAGYYQQAPQQGYYQQTPQPGYYQQAQQGIYHGQSPQYPPQYQQPYPAQPNVEGDGYAEIKRSPIEELSLAIGTNEIRAYGKAESEKDYLALNAARAQAIAALQEKIEVYVRAGLDQYAQRTGVNSEYSLDESIRNQVMIAVKGIVNGATVLDTRKLYNPNTKLYKYEVCVTYNRAGVISVMQQQSDRIRANEKKFEADMQHAFDTIDAQYNRMSLGEQRQMRQNEMEQQNLDRQHQRDMQSQNQQNQYELERQRIQTQNQVQNQQNQQNLENIGCGGWQRSRKF